jgi:hypothetical protein
MKVAAMKILRLVLIMGLCGGFGGAYAQATNSTFNAKNGTLVRNVDGVGEAQGAVPPGNSAGTNAGLSKGTDGIISSMRSNGTRTTESPNLRPPNRTGTMPGLH